MSGAPYSAASRIAARMVARKSSIGARRPPRSTCQKVQPLQAGSPWTSAPILWIEPTAASRGERPVRPHDRAMAAPGVDQGFPWPRQPRFDDA